MIRSIAVAGFVIAAGSAVAADLGVKKPSAPLPAPSAACKETSALPTDIFGFTTGSDVSDVGAWAGSMQYDGAFGTRGGTLSSHTGTAQITTSFIPCLETDPFFFGTTKRTTISGIPGDITQNAIGGGIEFKYKIISRAKSGIGWAIDYAPSVLGYDNFGNAKGGGAVYGHFFRTMADAELVKDKLYGAVNLEFGTNYDTVGSLPALKTSNVNARVSLSAQVIKDVYIGVEASHQRAYSGSFLNHDAGYANFVGPNFYWQATEKLSLNAAVGFQVQGKAKGASGNLDLTNYNREVARFKLAYAF